MIHTNTLLFALSASLGFIACGESKSDEPKTTTAKKKPAVEIEKKVPTAEPAKPVPVVSCPTKTVLTSIKHTPAGKKEPFALEPASFTFAKARMAEPGKLQVYVATKDWPLDTLGVNPSPATEVGDAYLSLTIRTEKVNAGSYEETGELKSPISVDLTTNGVASGLHIGKPSKVTILEISDKQVCGTFDVQGIFEGEKTKIVGSFAAVL